MTSRTANGKTILMLPLGQALAHVVRPLEVSRRLREMGHRVIFASDGPFLSLAREAGFEVRPLSEPDVSRAFSRILRGQPVASPEKYERLVREQLALYEEIQPDGIVRDMRVSAGISAAVARLPLVSIVNAYQTRYSPDPVFTFRPIPGLPPGAPGPGLTANLLAVHDEVRLRFGLPPLAHPLDIVSSDLNLMVDVPEYASAPGAPGNFVYVGPILWEVDGKPPDWLDRLDPDRPTLYLTIGSTGAREIFDVTIEAFGETRYQVLMTTAGTEVGPLPGNCFATHYAPGGELVRRSDVVVCHGGNGTAHQALHEGTPIIAWPYLYDQRWNARRQAELGVGLTLSALTPEAVRAAVEEVLGNPDYRSAARRFQRILAGYDGPRSAARLIEKYLET